MKILVLSNLYPPDTQGGYEMGCRQVVDALRERGHDVRVLTSAPRTPAPPEPHVRRRFRLTDVWDGYSFERGAPVTAALTQTESHRVNAFNVHVLLEELADFGPDVVYAWMIVGLGGLGLMGALHHLRMPWAWHLMDDVPILLCTSGGAVVPTFAREFERQLRGTYLSCSRQILDEIEQGGIRLGDDVEVIPNWVAGPRPPERSDYYQGGTLRIVAAAATIDRKTDKGIDLLIEAAALLRRRGAAGFEVDVFGRVADPYFPALVRYHGLNDMVHLRGLKTQAELVGLYGGYDVFAFPTHANEPFAFAPLEAMYHGCVPIMTDICGNSEWFVHGVHCLKAPRTAEAFAGALESVLDRTTDLEAIGRRASAVVARDFHLGALLPRIEAALLRASARSRAGAGTPEEAYRMAVLAEKLARVIVQESIGA